MGQAFSDVAAAPADPQESRVAGHRPRREEAALIPISASSPGKLFGRSKASTVILGDLLNTEENWDAED